MRAHRNYLDALDARAEEDTARAAALIAGLEDAARATLTRSLDPKGPGAPLGPWTVTAWRLWQP